MQHATELELTKWNPNSAGEPAAELSPVITIAGQHLRNIEPRIRGRRLLLEHPQINAAERNDRPIVSKVLLLGLPVRFLRFPSAIVGVADICAALDLDGKTFLSLPSNSSWIRMSGSLLKATMTLRFEAFWMMIFVAVLG